MNSYKSIFNKISPQFRRFYYKNNLNCFQKFYSNDSQIETNICIEMNDNNITEVLNEAKSEAMGEEQSTKRLKTDDNYCPKDAEEVIVNKRIAFKREKLRKWVLLLSYCGRGYYGMQRQVQDSTPQDNEFPTIEYRLFESLWRSGVITEDKYKGQHLCRFQRAARTDKGVSAIKQIVSLLLPVNFGEELLPKVNQLLPQEIQIIDCLRVTKFFDAKNFCDARTYSYLMPSYALCPFDEKTCESFRLKEEIVNELNDILRLYFGSNNFHNFTSNKKPTDASAKRYIMDMYCSQPFIENELEFVVIRVKGQSFMLHQIRKMIGLAIAVMRGFTNKETIVRAFNPIRIDIPRAPGLGLLLEEVHYDRYNEKYGGDGIHELIKWDHKNDLIHEFKHKHIYPVIVETEKKEKPMFEWLQTLALHTYDEREQKANDPLNPSKDRESSPLLKAFIKSKKEDKKTETNSTKTEDNVEKSVEII